MPSFIRIDSQRCIPQFLQQTIPLCNPLAYILRRQHNGNQLHGSGRYFLFRPPNDGNPPL